MICAPDGGDHRRPDRLPPRRGAVTSSSRTPSNAQVVERRAGRAARRLPGGARRPLARDGARARSRARASVEILAPLTDVDLGALRYYAIAEGTVAGHPGARRPDRLHRRGRLRGVRRDEPGRRAVGRALGRRAAARPAADRPRRPRHAPPRGRDAALRQRARPRRRTRSRPASAGSSSSTSRATSSAGRRSRRSPATAPRSASSGCVMQGRGIARHGYPVHAGDRDRRRDERHPVADARQGDRDGAMSLRPMPSRVRCSRSRSAISGSPAEVVDLPFYRDRLTPLPGRPATRKPPVEPARRAPRTEATLRRHRVRGGAPTMVPTDLRYTKDHEWVRVDGDEATVGITEYAAEPAGRHRLRRAAGRRPRARASSRRSASSSRSRPSATCSPRSPARSRRGNDALAGDAGAREQRPVRRGLDDPAPARRPDRGRRAARRRRLRRADRGGLSPDAVRTARRRRSRADARRRSASPASTSCSPTSPQDLRAEPPGPARAGAGARAGRPAPGPRGAQPDRPRVVPRGGRLPPLDAAGGRPAAAPRRVVHGLHARTSRRSARARSRASTSTSRSSPS